LTKSILETEKGSPLVEPINLPNGNFYVLIADNKVIPAYILNRKDEALVLWVHKDFRGKGYAKFMVKTLGIRFAVSVPESIPFWEKLGFQRKSNSNSGPTEMRK